VLFVYELFWAQNTLLGGFFDFVFCSLLTRFFLNTDKRLDQYILDNKVKQDAVEVYELLNDL